MPLVLTVPVSVAGQTVLLTPSIAVKLNDLFAAWNELDRQSGYVLPRRLAKATYWRARYDDAVRV
jgi:hypothetical protein